MDVLNELGQSAPFERASTPPLRHALASARRLTRVEPCTSAFGSTLRIGSHGFFDALESNSVFGKLQRRHVVAGMPQHSESSFQEIVGLIDTCSVVPAVVGGAYA